MKSIVVYASVSNGNTKKIAEIIAKKLNAELMNINQAKDIDISKYDLIGFGSGIFYSKHHRKLIEFVKNIKNLENKNVFIFSTSGLRRIKYIYDFHNNLRKEILKHNVNLLGEFNCLGFDKWAPLRIIGGINKSRPNNKDFLRAKKFANNLKINFSL